MQLFLHHFAYSVHVSMSLQCINARMSVGAAKTMRRQMQAVRFKRPRVSVSQALILALQSLLVFIESNNAVATLSRNEKGLVFGHLSAFSTCPHTLGHS